MSLPVSDNKNKPLGIYFHWGFCLSKCPYCDFMSRPLSDPADPDFPAWLAEYKKAFDFYLPFIKARPIRSIFFGGGTPSLLPSAFVAELIDYVSARADILPNAEITLEANPSSSSLAKFKDLKAAGINRLSLGVQSFDDDVLKFLGRIHCAAEAKTSLKNAQDTFAEVSFDMIYAYPHHTAADWQKQLSEALAFSSPHLSLYQLTIDKGCAFYRRRLKPLPDDEAADLFALTFALTAEHGIPAYEVSNHARPGHQSVHNLGYWHYEDYLGLGPSAHGRINGIATEQYRNPFVWLKKRNKNSVFTPLSASEKLEERLLMGMRLYEGVPAALIDETRATPWLKNGFLVRKGANICPTFKGIMVLNRMLPELVPDN